jgi:hypothetical protein
LLTAVLALSSDAAESQLQRVAALQKELISLAAAQVWKGEQPKKYWTRLIHINISSEGMATGYMRCIAHLPFRHLQTPASAATAPANCWPSTQKLLQILELPRRHRSPAAHRCPEQQQQLDLHPALENVAQPVPAYTLVQSKRTILLTGAIIAPHSANT